MFFSFPKVTYLFTGLCLYIGRYQDVRNFEDGTGSLNFLGMDSHLTKGMVRLKRFCILFNSKQNDV